LDAGCADGVAQAGRLALSLVFPGMSAKHTGERRSYRRVALRISARARPHF
jgi:hypothetical protein